MEGRHSKNDKACIGSASDITRGTGVTANAGLNSINSASWTTGAPRDLTDFVALLHSCSVRLPPRVWSK